MPNYREKAVDILDEQLISLGQSLAQLEKHLQDSTMTISIMVYSLFQELVLPGLFC
jgi:hypothetical protein